MASEKKETESKDSNKNGVSDEDARKESSKIAKQATEAQNKATELMKAAAAAGDPDERQKLMEQALEQQIQSKSLGKTARYLRSGTFQGMAVGAGFGIAPGASLGAITGTLVGGVSSTALGGLGAGIGAATGAIHGPFWDLGEGASKGIQKITNSLPGWKATESQKKQLEKMVGQINEQKTPGADELESWGNDCASDDQKEALETAKSAMPSMPSAGNPDKLEQQKESAEEKGFKDESKEDMREQKPSKKEDEESQGQHRETEDHGGEVSSAAVQTGKEGRKKPRKLQPKSNDDNSPSTEAATTKKPPRKLEKRSA